MRALRVMLAVSLILNLFFIGAIAGGILFLNQRHPMILAGALRVEGTELPGAAAQAFRAALQDTRRALQAPSIDRRDALGEAARLLRDPALDQAAVLTALGRARAADMTIRTAVEARAVAFIATLPATDRARLADAVRRRADRGRGPALPP